MSQWVKLAEEQGEIVRKIKEDMKADPASHTKEELDAAVAKLKELKAKADDPMNALEDPVTKVSAPETPRAARRPRAVAYRARVSAPWRARRPPGRRRGPRATRRTRRRGRSDFLRPPTPGRTVLRACRYVRAQGKYDLVRSVGEECVTDGELAMLMARKPDSFVLYDGFEPSGRMHIAQVSRAGLPRLLRLRAGPPQTCSSAKHATALRRRVARRRRGPQSTLLCAGGCACTASVVDRVLRAAGRVQSHERQQVHPGRWHLHLLGC